MEGLSVQRHGLDLSGLFWCGNQVQNRAMSDATNLPRIDPAKNMRRFSRLDVRRDLFSARCFIRESGRIGRTGQVRMVRYPTAADAHEALGAQLRMKGRRGYVQSISRYAQWKF
jgi:predicted DNA-binding WGR domain protein